MENRMSPWGKAEKLSKWTRKSRGQRPRGKKVQGWRSSEASSVDDKQNSFKFLKNQDDKPDAMQSGIDM